MEEKKEFRPEAVIELLDSGPMKITGNFIVKDMKTGEESAPGEIWICRCGESTAKPYCDRSHKNH